MGASNPVRRKQTARDLAERFNVTPRTIARLVAEPRTEFEERARNRRARAVELRAIGLKYREIAEQMNCSTGAVGRLLYDAKKIAAVSDAESKAS